MHVQVISNFFEQIIRIIMFITILPKINNETSKNKSGEELMSELVSSIDYYNTFSL